MAIFQDLPVEIILEILHHTYLPDLESLARVSHTIRNVARPTLQSDLELRSSITKVTRKLRKIKHGGRALVLYDILSTPRLAHYVRKLDLRKWFLQWEAPLPELKTQGPYNAYPNDMTNAFGQAVAVEKLIPPSLKGMWIQKIEQGDEAPIMALVCMMLPNLTHLRIDTHVIRHPCFQSFLQYILSPASAGRALAEVFVEDYPMIRIDDDDDRKQWIREIITLACEQPSYGRIDYIDMGAGASVISDVPDQGQLSPMAYDSLSVKFRENAFDIQIVKDLLSCTNQLSDFNYVSGSGWALGLSYVYSMCEYLQRIAKETLQTLCIRSSFGPPEHGGGPDGDLSSSKLLHTVELATRFLLDAGGDFLRYEFPKSIRSVTLHHDLFEEDCTIYYELLDELSANKTESLPNLQTIIISGLGNLFEALSDSHYTTSLKSIRIELMLKRENEIPMERLPNLAMFATPSRV